MKISLLQYKEKNLIATVLTQSEISTFCTLQSLACRGPNVPEIHIVASLLPTVEQLSNYRFHFILQIFNDIGNNTTLMHLRGRLRRRLNIFIGSGFCSTC